MILGCFSLTLLTKKVAGDTFTSRALAAEFGSTETVEVIEIAIYSFCYNLRVAYLLPATVSVRILLIERTGCWVSKTYCTQRKALNVRWVP